MSRWNSLMERFEKDYEKLNPSNVRIQTVGYDGTTSFSKVLSGMIFNLDSKELIQCGGSNNFEPNLLSTAITDGTCRRLFITFCKSSKHRIFTRNTSVACSFVVRLPVLIISDNSDTISEQSASRSFRSWQWTTISHGKKGSCSSVAP
mmetsp:Transcript_12324/g.29261  ORF Transcript_12324/g.29261 Transcript_12324/m.29261 type:complete len:148 (+) Transcript_12324:1255-1698(+)